MLRTVLPILWFVLGAMITLSSSRTFCPRIFFQNIDEDTMPYKMIEGVYVKQNYEYNDFPVYRRENDRLLFYYSTNKYGLNKYVFGLSFNHSFGIAAEVFGFSNPTVWPSSGSLNRDDVFGGLVRKWLYYHNREWRYRAVQTNSSSPMIKAVCVDQDFRECNSDRVYLNESFNDGRGNTLNDPARDYFYRKLGVFRNLRPVYEHSRQSWYLQYVDGYWVVTAAYAPRNSEDKAYMRVKDPALRPEFITKPWSVHYHKWRDMAKLRVLCRGVTTMSNSCPSKPCHGKATCIYTSRNETLCVCPPGFTGVNCDINKQCPTPRPIAGKELNFAYQGKRPGSLGMSFCSSSYPSVRFSLCVDGKYNTLWSRQGIACRKARYFTPAYTPRPWNRPTPNLWFTETRRTRNPWNTGGISTENSWWGTERYTSKDIFGTETQSSESATPRVDHQRQSSTDYSVIIVAVASSIAGVVIVILLPLALCRDNRQYKRATGQYQYSMAPVYNHQPTALYPNASHSSLNDSAQCSSGGSGE